MTKLTGCLICGSPLIWLRRHGAYYCSKACKQKAWRMMHGRSLDYRLSPAQLEQRRLAGAASAEAKVREGIERAIAVLSRLGLKS